MGTRWWLAVIILLVSVTPGAAQKVVTQDKRVALVIGIGRYQHAPPLANPSNDAKRVSAALRNLNFEVDEALDVDYRAFGKMLREFGKKASQADAALIYYAGHGVQVDRENYLLPADAKLERERDLVYEAMPLDTLLGEASQARKVGIVLLDACRNNPFSERISRDYPSATRGSAAPGLARIDKVPRNTLVAMATRADEVAEDGFYGNNSPFAQAFLQTLQTPGVELAQIFRNVRDAVLKATNNRQEPYVFSSLGAESFYFNPRPPNRSPEIAQLKPLEVTDTAGPTPLGIPRPTDPDDDPLFVRVFNVPRSGEIRVDGKVIKNGDQFPLDRFLAATYKPTGDMRGVVGTLDFMVDDRQGGQAIGVLQIVVTSSNRPPVVEAPHTVRVYPGALEIKPPSDPDNDPLTITVTAVPRGQVRNGVNPVRVGDKLKIAEMATLTFIADPNTSGDVGALVYSVDDGRGGKAEGRVQVQVAPPDEKVLTDEGIWQRLADRGTAEEIEAFIRLFPNSRFVAAARDKQKQLVATATPPRTFQQPDRVASVGTPPPGKPEPQSNQDCPTCPIMVRLPGGEFQMGDQTYGPPRRVTVRAFLISQTPVTVGEWKACVVENGCSFMPRMVNPTDAMPVHNVSWQDAKQYIAWLKKKTGKPYRLPTEAEWEYAARGGTATKYWWGNEIGTTMANCQDCGTGSAPAPAPVRSFGANPFGLFDMAGGVAQWVEDCYVATYQGAPVDGSARDQKSCQNRVLRGGSFRSDQTAVTVTARSQYDASVRYIANGFRVAADLK